MNPNENPNQAPISQPTRYTCPNCGFGWNEPTPFCPRCGAAQTAGGRQKASGVVLALYGCGFLLFGALGACFALLGIEPVGRGSFNVFALIGLALLACALFLLYKLIRGGR